MHSVRLYDGIDIHDLVWPESIESQQACHFFLPLLKEGVHRYISNVQTKLFLLQYEDLLLPLTVNEREYGNSYVASNAYAIPYLKERLSKHHPLFSMGAEPFLYLGDRLLRAIQVNKVVLLNNWLTVTSSLPEISTRQIEAITDYLQGRFPDHLLMIRNVNTIRGESASFSLTRKGFKLIGTRLIYVYDPERKKQLSSKVHYHHRRDRRLVEKEGYEIVRSEDFFPEDFPRILELYEKVYVKKYTPFSPRYTLEFINHVFKSGSWKGIAVKKEGRIDGFIGYCVHNQTMIVPIMGYDTALAASVGLYRMVTGLIIKEAERLGLLLNDSSGAAVPKKYRGMVARQEYTAVYFDHLPWMRHTFWKFITSFCGYFQR